MSRRRSVVLACALLSLPALVPGATTTQPAQKAAAEAIAAGAIASEIVCDAEGKVIKLAISNHTGTTRGMAGNKAAAGVTPELFVRIVELPDLEAIAIEKQSLGDESYRPALHQRTAATAGGA